MSLRHSATPSLAYVLPTRNRPEVLGRTLEAIGSLPRHDAEVIVVDNASDTLPTVRRTLENGIGVRVIGLDENIGAAARNVGVRASDPGASWIVMLDDDSHPRSADFVRALSTAPSDVLAISADIHLPSSARREDGGLPEVFIGCGVAVRRDAFLASGGYDPSFSYYVEEYDLAARLMLMGGRVAFEPSFVVEHHKVAAGRDMDLILARLIRNNGWVAQRYCPESERRAEIRRLRDRYRAIAEKESAMPGFARGLLELRRTRAAQARRGMPREMYDRFTGLAHARDAIRSAIWERPFRTAALVARGKNDWAIERALFECRISIAPEPAEADAIVVGSMSPGPMIDAAIRLANAHLDRRIITPWTGAVRVAADAINPLSATSAAWARRAIPA